MTGDQRRPGQAIGFTASIAVHVVLAAIVVSVGIFGPGPEREVGTAATGVDAPSADSRGASQEKPTAQRRQTVVPRTTAAAGPSGGARGRPGSRGAEYAMLPGEGFVDSGASAEGRTVFQAILSFSQQVESRGSLLLDHLWQSTLFAVAAALLALAFRRNRAEVRYRIWFAASAKFLVPFALFAEIGRRLPGAPVAQSLAERSAAALPMGDALPQLWSAVTWPSAAASSMPAGWMATGLLAVWAAGCAGLLAIRLVQWQRIRRAVRASRRLELADLVIPGTVSVRSTPGLLEPGVVGWSRPVLLMPDGIEQHLTTAQLETVVAHELCHVRRQDNLTAAIHMLVEAIFWFHPMVWWIGARLVDERERACDEDVLSRVETPQVYAEAILGVCKRYVESPLVCVAGVSGSSIAARIAAIVRNRIGAPLPAWKRTVAAASAVLAVAAPIGAGIMTAPRVHAHMEVRSVPALALVPMRIEGQPGPRLSAATVDCSVLNNLSACTPQSVGGHISGRGVTTAQLADLLSKAVKMPVIDRTALSGRFEIDLTWAPEHAPGSIFAAVRDQLGLTLEPTTAPIEVVVIEGASSLRR